MSVDAYGLRFDNGTLPATIELECFYRNWQPAQGGLGRYGHLHNAIDLLDNEPRRRLAAERKREYDPRKDDALIWNEWSEWMLETFCENQWVTVTGPNASWKTTCAGNYGLKRWMCSPHDTIVVMTSTSIPGLKKRIWKEIVRYYMPYAGSIGNLVPTDLCIRFIKGSDASGIFGIATGQDGDVQKAVNKIIGFHATNVIAIVDEMHATNEAIVKACLSLEAGADHFQFIGLGNAASELDPHGQMCEPVAGWNTISVDSDEWQTKRGICIHLDGEDCPRVKEGDEFYPGLLMRRDLESTKRDYGEDSPEYWQTRRGFWPPMGATKTVLNPTLITQFCARDKVTWVGSFTKGAALDPSFEGGDRCVFRVGRCGEADGGRNVLALGKPVLIHKSAVGQEEIAYQIVRQVKDLCAAEGIGPDMFALDSTGAGSVLAAVFRREWAPGILDVQFGGGPSNDPISQFNPRPAREEYVNKVTELWYIFRLLVENDQIRELDADTAIEFCQRRYLMRGNLRLVEAKSDMKQRTGRSPDFADNAVILAALFRKRSFLLNKRDARTTTDDRWRKVANRYNVLNTELVEA